MNIYLYITFIIIPAIFWLCFFRWKDRSEPEPRMLTLKLFLFWGAVAVMASIGIEFFVDLTLFPNYDLFNESFVEYATTESLGVIALSLFLAGIAEEIIKFIILKKVIYNAPSFNQIRDGVIYGVSLALGFAFFENTFYFLDFMLGDMNQSEITTTLLVRAVGPLLLHTVATGIMGLYIGKSKFSEGNKKKFLFKGVMLAILLHGVYNVLIVFPGGILYGLPMILVGLVYLVGAISRMESGIIWRLAEKND